MSGQSTHFITYNAGVLDATGLVRAVCSCGRYQSAYGTEESARRAGDDHIKAVTT